MKRENSMPAAMARFAIPAGLVIAEVIMLAILAYVKERQSDLGDNVIRFPTR